MSRRPVALPQKDETARAFGCGADACRHQEACLTGAASAWCLSAGRGHAPDRQGGSARRFRSRACDRGGCIAEYAVTDAELGAIAKGADLTISAQTVAEEAFYPYGAGARLRRGLREDQVAPHQSAPLRTVTPEASVEIFFDRGCQPCVLLAKLCGRRLSPVQSLRLKMTTGGSAANALSKDSLLRRGGADSTAEDPAPQGQAARPPAIWVVSCDDNNGKTRLSRGAIGLHQEYGTAHSCRSP